MERNSSDAGFKSYCQADREGEVSGTEPSRTRSNTWPSVPYHGVGCKTPKKDQDRGPARDGKESTASPDGVRNLTASVSAKPTGSRKNPWGGLSYAELITMAIESSPEKRMTLSELYDWMVKNVPYFSDKGDSFSSAGWKNSIRHNLSLHSRFVRVINETTGKSSWWMVNHDMKPGLTSRRRALSMDTKVFEKKRGRMRKKLDDLPGGHCGVGMGIGGGTAEVDSTTSSPPRPGYSRNIFDGNMARYRTGNGISWIMQDFPGQNKHSAVIQSNLEPTLEESFMTFPNSHFQDTWTDQCDHLLPVILSEEGTCDMTVDNSKPVSESLAEVIAGNLNMCEREVVSGIDYLFDMPSMERPRTGSRGWRDTCTGMATAEVVSMEERLPSTGYSQHENVPMEEDCMLVDRRRESAGFGIDGMLSVDYSNQAPQCFERAAGASWPQSSCFTGNGVYQRERPIVVPTKQIFRTEENYVHPELHLKQLGSRWISSPSMYNCSPRKISIANGMKHSPSNPLVAAAYVQSCNRRRIPTSLESVSGSSERPYLQYTLESPPSRPYATKLYRDDVHCLSGAWSASPGQMCGLDLSNHEWGSTNGQLSYPPLRVPQFPDESRSMDFCSFSHRDISSTAPFSPFRSK